MMLIKYHLWFSTFFFSKIKFFSITILVGWFRLYQSQKFTIKLLFWYKPSHMLQLFGFLGFLKIWEI